MNLRDRCIQRSKASVQDCLVIGAGINGAVVAAALSARGAKVTLVDKGDFASCTSQESSNLIWGGIKYLETKELGLVWKLCGCRNRLLRAYPSQLQRIRFIASLQKGFRRSPAVVFAGAVLYWILGRFTLPPPRLLTRSMLLRRVPEADPNPVIGGVEYSDGHVVVNDARFVFGFIRRCIDNAGNTLNYMRLDSAIREGGLWVCTLCDECTGENITLRARCLVNTAGPFADSINHMLGVQSAYKHVFSRGSHIIVPRISPLTRVLAFSASDGRLFFMAPMGDCTCIGTTDVQVQSEHVEIPEEDVDFLLDNANRLLALERPLSRDDVISTRCGVRPLAVNANATTVGTQQEWMSLSRKHALDVHPDTRVVSVYGGKLTDCLNVGKAVLRTVESFGIPIGSPRASWFGEPPRAVGVKFRSEARQIGLAENVCEDLWRRYGRDAFCVLEKMHANPESVRPVLGGYLRAELEYMADVEMIVRLEDFLRRRTMLELVTNPDALVSDPGLQEAAEILFPDDAAGQVQRYRDSRKPHSR